MNNNLHYFDLKIIPQAEGAVHGLVFQTVHRCLKNFGERRTYTERIILQNGSVREKECLKFNGRIGLSLPEYHADHPGDVLRLVGTENDLQALLVQLRENRIDDYAVIQPIAPVPENVRRYACYQRMRPLGKPSRSECRRMEKRWRQKGVSDDEIQRRVESWQTKKAAKFPYFTVESSSTGQKGIPIYIQKMMTETPQTGTFTAYGLNRNGSTVPEF